MPKSKFREINKQALMELMEKVAVIESEEEQRRLIMKFLKDTIEGKITPYE